MKLEKWDRWLQRIHDDIVHLAASRAVHDRVAEIIAANDALPKKSAFYGFLEGWYVDSVVMGLRRQVKIDKQSVSLAGLLDDIAKNPECLTREHYISLYAGSTAAHRASTDFDQFATPGAPHIDPARVLDDLNLLRNSAKSCEAYADRYIAHRDPRELQTLPTYRELGEAYDALYKTLRKYTLMIRADNLVGITPSILDNWERVFTVPWLVNPRISRGAPNAG